MTKAQASRRAVCFGAVLALLSFTLAPQAIAGPNEEEKTERDSVFIDSNEDFNPANGVRSGMGTKKDPFVISNWEMRELFIRDTDRYVVIENNLITNRLTLNWVGNRVRVVKNEIGDLRVNQNVRRTGEATSGLIAHNRFGTVGQLRHFDGVFAHNLVQPTNVDLFGALWGRRGVLFDGFHGSRFFDNVIYGYLDVKLHGHHHGSTFDGNSHYHGTPAAEEEGHEGHEHGDEKEAHAKEPKLDHSKRFHEVFVYNNTIKSAGPYALIYRDSPHSVDDRTAASETNEALNDPHIHYTRVHLLNNKLVGSGMQIDVFNAKDDHHTGTTTGLLEVRGNSIALSNDTEDTFTRESGINVARVTDLDLRLVGNMIAGDKTADPLDERWSPANTGIRIFEVDMGSVYIKRNAISDLHYGVYATQFTETTHWWINELATTNVAEPVYWDSSVANQPHRGP